MSDDASTDPLVVFTPSGARGNFPVGTPIAQAARQLGVDIDSICGGNGMCGRCQVDIGDGDFALHGLISGLDNVSEPNRFEARYAEKRGLIDGRRLSCQATVQGDLVVDVPPESQVHKQVVRKSADERRIAIDPTVRIYYIEVREPDMHDPSGDWRRVQEALKERWNIEPQRIDLGVLRTLQPVLRKGKWAITVAVHEGTDVIAIWPGLQEATYGFAVDLGSTTIAAHLCDLATGYVVASGGIMNPQIRYGEDLMSRVSYSMLNPGGEEEMTVAVREAMNHLFQETADQVSLSPQEIVDLVIVGNPVMHHLLLGIDPVELGGAPFALATDHALNLKASELGFQLAPGARTYILPCIAGHVGADTAGVVLAEAPYEHDPLTLAVDVGTNAEMVLGNSKRMLAASSPTGPAFEGAQISGGQRAAPGAIERVRIDPSSLEPRFRVIGSQCWSNEAEFETEAGDTGVTGICGSGIIEVLGEMFLAGIIKADGTIDGAKAAVSDRIIAEGRTFSYLLHELPDRQIKITQNDVRAIQLAKGALYAGARLLMDKFEVDTVDQIQLAGAFGSHIDTKYAMVLGMLPDCLLENVKSVGNAAGTGARIALLNAAARREIEDVVRRIEKVETAVEPKFQDHFVGAMGIPHASDPYTRLQESVTLPERSEPSAEASDDGGRRRRRRRG